MRINLSVFALAITLALATCGVNHANAQALYPFSKDITRMSDNDIHHVCALAGDIGAMAARRRFEGELVHDVIAELERAERNRDVSEDVSTILLGVILSAYTLPPNDVTDYEHFGGMSYAVCYEVIEEANGK